ncbi:MAG TPA: amino acid adenylation domain-containing protein, partial [Thermoanaerobaculia bacterium]|nr:amino acid adenylation domain-containing protein [Thermoanaerobaculia bacterium]
GYRSAPLVAAILGVFKAGAAYTILDPDYPAGRLVDYVNLVKPQGWVRIPAAGLPQVELEEALSALPLRCRLDLEMSEEDCAAPDPLAALPSDEPGVDAGVLVGPDDIAYISFTSGSTGMPKGILGRHGPLTHFLPWQTDTFGFFEDDRYSMLAGLSHDPLQREIFTPLQLGATVCIPDPAEIGTPGYLARWMARERITIAHLTPAMGQLLAQGNQGDVLQSEPPVLIPTLRYAFFVGDVLTRRDIERLRRLAPAITCVNYYGSTETQRAVGYHVIEEGGGGDDERLGRQIVPLGRGMQDVQLLILGSAGELAGVGELGEIAVRSPHLARGYLGDEDLSRSKFVVNPFTGEAGDRLYRTGDLGRYRPDGLAVFSGRADLQVKLRGFRIELGEIEALLGRFPGVREAAVILREDRPGEKLLAAYVVAEDGRELPLDEVRRLLQSRLPAYMVPAALLQLPELPLTPNRKLDRRALPAPLWSGGGEVAEDEPLTPLEELVAGVWREVLGVPRARRSDDFFALGGHSLLATQVLSRLGHALGLTLPIRAIFEHPTVAAMAGHLERQLRERSSTGAPPVVRVSRDQPLRLSFAQQRLFFLYRLEPDSAAFNLPTALRLTGELDVAALARSFTGLVARHESLRTRFRQDGGEPLQVIDPPSPVPLPLADLSGLPVYVAGIEARRLAFQEAQRPFDLDRGPVLRVLLVRLGSLDHTLAVTMHHIVSDGWSRGILVREMTRLYQLFSQERDPELPPLPFQYADIAAWQRDWLQGDELESQVAYWKERLADAPEVLALPLDRPRQAGSPMPCGVESRGLPAALGEQLEALSRRSGVTLFMTLLTGFTVLLHRYCGQDDVVVGTDVANRNRIESEGVIGFFINQLVLRTDLSGDPKFMELLDRVRETTLGAYLHQDLPFDKLVEVLKPGRSLGHSPLFQVKCTLQNVPRSTLSLPGLGIEAVEAHRGKAQIDLLLNLFEMSGGVRASMEYNADLFDAPTIAKMLSAYELVLSTAASRPEARVSELLEVLAAADRSRRVEKAKSFDDTFRSQLRGAGRRRSGQAQPPTAIGEADMDLREEKRST